ncbi:MAG TPA: GNAT family N-acetyltransferase [Lactobacillaceae bacterium]|jgi:ribosomal protein S18 acetylase RimI-like enzyme
MSNLKIDLEQTLNTWLNEFNHNHDFIQPNKYPVQFQIEEGSKIIGGITGYIQGSAAYITLLAVDPDKRQTGIGRQLLFKFEEAVASKNVETISLSTYSFQAPQFYVKNDYVIVGTLKNTPRNGIDKIYLQKFLNNSIERSSK